MDEIIIKQIKDALLPLYELNSVNLLHPKEAISKLLHLENDKLSEIWEEKCAEAYNELIKMNELKSLNTLSKEFDSFEKEYKNLKLFKVSNVNTYKKKDPKGIPKKRVFSTRSLWGNWIISRFMLNTKSSMWSHFSEERNRILNTLSINNENNGKSYGYLLSVNGLHKYLKTKDWIGEVENEPYIYFNWRWAYNLYINDSLKNLKDYNAIKIDLEDAFQNLSLNELIDEKNEFFNNSLYILARLNMMIAKNNTSGIRYGFIIESYVIANWELMKFKYKIFEFNMSCFKNGDTINISKVNMYVDDAYIFYTGSMEPSDITSKLKKFLEKNRNNNSSIFKINEDKTNYYRQMQYEAMKAESSSSLANIENIDNIKFYKEYLDSHITSEIKKPMELNKYSEMKLKIGENWKNLENNIEINWDDIIENKYLKIFIKDGVQNYGASFIDSFSEYTSSLKNKAGHDAKEDNVNIWKILTILNASMYVWPKSDSIKYFRSVVDELLYYIYYNKAYKDLNIASRKYLKYLSQYKMNIPSVTKLFSKKKIMDNLIRITSFIEKEICQKKYNKSMYVKINEKDLLNHEIKNIKFSELIGRINDYLIGFKNNEENFDGDHLNNIEEEISRDYYHSKLKKAILSKVKFIDNKWIVSVYIANAIKSSLNRIDLIKRFLTTINFITKTFITLDTNSYTTKPIFYEVLNDEDYKMFFLIKNTLRFGGTYKDSITITRKLLIAYYYRHYLKMLWNNGSRELEHFSNHGVMHVDNLIKNLYKFMLPISDKISEKKDAPQLDKYQIVLSLIMHDISLIGDEEMFSNIDFLNDNLFKNIDSTEDLINSYIKFREKMSNATRKNHGLHSAILSNHIIDKDNFDKRALNINIKNKIMHSSAVHNSHPTIIQMLSNTNDTNIFMVAFLDILDTKWTRIGRPLQNIGTYTLTSESKRYAFKDIIVEKWSNFKFKECNNLIWELHLHRNTVQKIVKKARTKLQHLTNYNLKFDVNNHDDKILLKTYDIYDKNNIESLTRFNNFVSESSDKKMLDKFIIYSFFHVEFDYMPDNNRNIYHFDGMKKYMYLFEEKIFFRTNLEIKLIDSTRSTEYNTLRSSGKNELWYIDVIANIFQYIIDNIKKYGDSWLELTKNKINNVEVHF